MKKERGTEATRCRALFRLGALWATPGGSCLGVFQRPLTLILLQKHRDTNGRRIVIQIGGVYAPLCQEEGMLWQKYRDRNGRCIAIPFKSIGVGGRFDSANHAWNSLLQALQSGVGHFLRGRSLKGRCNIRVYVPVCVPVCVCVCVSLLSPPKPPPILWG